MIDFPLYHQFVQEINNAHPHLINESMSQLFDSLEAKSLGNFLEIDPKYLDRYNQYYIVVSNFHSEHRDVDKVIPVLLHEYGHFLCRTVIYPKLFGLGRFLLKKLGARPANSHCMTWDYSTRVITVLEELAAWLISWGILFKKKLLKIKHITYGWNCWKTYWWRLKVK